MQFLNRLAHAALLSVIAFLFAYSISHGNFFTFALALVAYTFHLDMERDNLWR